VGGDGFDLLLERRSALRNCAMDMNPWPSASSDATSNRT
jgi:hypothetical protein